MTDTDLIKKKLAFIETCVRELEEIADPSRLDTDVREQRLAPTGVGVEFDTDSFRQPDFHLASMATVHMPPLEFDSDPVSYSTSVIPARTAPRSKVITR